MKPGTIVNATFNGCHCFAEITDTGEKFGETFYSVVLLSPCVMEHVTIPEGTKTWVWPEMVTVETDYPTRIGKARSKG
jgi:hypothetical protein